MPEPVSVEKLVSAAERLDLGHFHYPPTVALLCPTCGREWEPAEPYSVDDLLCPTGCNEATRDDAARFLARDDTTPREDGRVTRPSQTFLSSTARLGAAFALVVVLSFASVAWTPLGLLALVPLALLAALAAKERSRRALALTAVAAVLTVGAFFVWLFSELGDGLDQIG